MCELPRFVGVVMMLFGQRCGEFFCLFKGHL